MATITIEYDARNKVLRKAIEFILSVGAKKVEVPRRTGIDEALDDIKNGRVKEIDDLNAYFKKFE